MRVSRLRGRAAAKFRRKLKKGAERVRETERVAGGKGASEMTKPGGILNFRRKRNDFIPRARGLVLLRE